MSRTRNSPTVASSFTKPSRRDHGGTLLGIFVGLVIGLGMAASVAFWLMKNNPALQSPVSANNAREPVKEPSRAAKNDTAEKPRFDFYKILPGADETRGQAERKPTEKTDRAVVEQAKERANPKAPDRAVETTQERAPSIVASVDPSKAAKGGDKFWLQAGSFSTESDAENLKARLAFAGWEASVQQGLLPDKVIRFRVRLGPYDNQDEMQRIKGELGKRGFEAAVIKF
ncbi:MAG TPA: SPOR domain-containing protein [Casimicrobiaceae bacterium]|nr:SPOR domain-containing protein [Casimicrobiaceae bacterium]